MKKIYSTKSTLLTGTLFLTLAGILTRIIGFFYRIFLSRTIGAEGLGIYQLIAPSVLHLPLQGSRPPYPNSFPWKLEEKMMPVPKPIFRSGFLSPYAFPHSAAFFSIIMRILLLFPGLVISGARRSLLCSPFPLSHAVSMPVSTVIIMV